jgi:membrane protein YdbS with pleckstrin-like domain
VDEPDDRLTADDPVPVQRQPEPELAAADAQHALLEDHASSSHPRSLEAVDELFAPPGAHWRPVSPALARVRRLLLCLTAGVAVLALVVLELLLPLAWWDWLFVPLVLALGVAGWVLIGRSARWWAYAERDEDLYIRHGALFRGMVVVPYGRMQYVDVHAGPLEQLFGVATVHLHTASPGTSARIPGLPAEEAARLRDRLTALGESEAAGL